MDKRKDDNIQHDDATSAEMKEKKKNGIDLSRRKFFAQFGLATCGLITASSALPGCALFSLYNNTLVGDINDGVGKDYSPTTGLERTAVPSACWQCVARDAMIGYVEDGRLAKAEGNHRLLRTNGKLCSKGQGGVNQVYDPDRLLFPMRRIAGTARGADQWQRITWDEAVDELVRKLQAVRDDDPGKLVFHYGRMKASSSKLIKDYFLYGFGTKSAPGHTSICESNKWTSQELVWGKHYDVNDVENSKTILVFGSNPLEAHTNHLPLSQRIVTAVNDNNAKMYTFDVRLSNTAAKSTQWIPIKPGTDLAVVLAMAYHILDNDLLPQKGKDFINTWTNIDATGYADKVAKLTAVLKNPRQYLSELRTADSSFSSFFTDADQPAGGYTPAWAESISGVSSSTIESIAAEYASNSPGSTIISYRGAVMHFNGVMTENAIQMLEGICGNIDVQGGRVHGVGASWSYSTTYPKPSSSGLSSMSFENKSAYVAASHGANHQILSQVKKAYESSEAVPSIYFVYCYTPAYANGDMLANIDVLKNTNYLPYIVVSDVCYSEAAKYADLLLPDTTYLERWDWEDMVSNNMIKEYYIRQPVITPLGQVRDLKDVFIEVADELSTGSEDELQKVADVGSMENFVKAACNDTSVVNDAGVAKGYADGFAFMKAEGAWYDPNATPAYEAYKTEVTLDLTDPATIADDDDTEYIFKDSEGICWETTKADYNEGYRNVSSAYKHYQGQEINGTIYKGFAPDNINKSGYFELDSVILKNAHYPSMPIWMKIPEHESLNSDELILTTYKIATQIHSRSQNCKYLSEITHHEPAWLNSTTASALGVSDGDTVRLTRSKTLYNDKDITESLRMGTATPFIEVEVKVTDAIHPNVIAIAHHLGHWAYGRYATADTNKHPLATDTDQMAQVAADPDVNLIWWKKSGYRGNWIMPNAGDPIGGGQRVFDTVVKVESV